MADCTALFRKLVSTCSSGAAAEVAEGLCCDAATGLNWLSGVASGSMLALSTRRLVPPQPANEDQITFFSTKTCLRRNRIVHISIVHHAISTHENEHDSMAWRDACSVYAQHAFLDNRKSHIRGIV